MAAGRPALRGRQKIPAGFGAGAAKGNALAQSHLTLCSPVLGRAPRPACKCCLEVLQKPFDNQIPLKYNIRAGNEQQKMSHCPLIGEPVIHSACVAYGWRCELSAPVYLWQRNPDVHSWHPQTPSCQGMRTTVFGGGVGFVVGDLHPGVQGPCCIPARGGGGEAMLECWLWGPLPHSPLRWRPNLLEAQPRANQPSSCLSLPFVKLRSVCR